MLKKGNKLYAILSGKCPKCHNESMYINKNPYIMSEVLEMHEHCSFCNIKYKMEPSFFYGSMYVSYGIAIGFAIGAFVIARLFFNSSLFVSFISIVFTILFFLPVILRLSRNIWINLFIHYEKSLNRK